MQRGAAKKKARASTAPHLGNNWDLEVNDSRLPVLDCIEITAQLPGVTHALIFGAVKTPPPRVTAYALMNGEVRDGLVSFNLFIDGTVYTFTGTVNPEGDHITDGNITPPPPPHTETDPGSWSAQAQSGGGA